MAKIKRDAVRKLGLFPALGFIVAALALFGGVALQSAPAVYAGVVQLSDQIGFGGGDDEVTPELLGSGVELHEAGGQTGRWHNTHAVGVEKSYTLKLDNNPNIADPAALANAVKVVVSVDDVTIDGVAYNGTATSATSPATASKLVEICHGTCAHGSSDWGTSLNLYFATAAKTISVAPAGEVYKWDVAQTIKVRPIDDKFDDLTAKKTRISHTFTNYSGIAVQYVRVAVTDDDTRGTTFSVGGSNPHDAYAETISEHASNPSYVDMGIKLRSRPQAGAVKLTVTAEHDSKDPGNDISWILKSGGTSCNSSSYTTWVTGSDSSVEFIYDAATWDTTQRLCIRLDKDSVIHTSAEVVKLHFTASDSDATKKTDYGASSTSKYGAALSHTWWTRTVTQLDSPVKGTATFTINDGDTASVTFGGADISSGEISLDE